MMVPIFFYFQLPACLPIFAGMFCGIAGLPAILMGTVIYYLSNILQQTMNQLASGSAHGKVYSLIAARAIDNKDLLLRIAVTSAVTRQNTREETFEFEDEEYYYYVRAIPKVTVEEEEFNVTQITVPSHRFSLKRKEHKQEHKEQDKEKGEEI